MKKITIDNDRYIVYFNNKYYVVNNYTYNLLKRCKPNADYKIKCNTQTVKEGLQKLFEAMKNVEYYENNIELPYPLKLQWKITTKCNLRCKHCYIGENCNDRLDNNTLLQICDSIIKAGIMEVTITGGEALTVDVLDRIVIQLLDKDIKVNIFTNATLLYEFIHRIKKNIRNTKLLEFLVSVDGFKDTHEYIRGNGTYNKTIKGIKYAKKNGFVVTTNTVLSTLNYKEVPQLYVFLKNKIKVDKIQISNLIVQGRAEKEMALTSIQHDEVFNELKKIYKKGTANGVLLYSKMPSENCDQPELYELNNGDGKYLGKENWKCCAGIGKATINADGKVYCCPFIKQSLLGDITKEDIKQIWDNKQRYEFLDYLAKNNNSRICVVARNRDKGGELNVK